MMSRFRAIAIALSIAGAAVVAPTLTGTASPVSGALAAQVHTNSHKHVVKTHRAQSKANRKGTAGTYNRWKWFRNTFWIVPKRGIYSIYQAEDDKFVVTKGQTVFHITDYFNGYWTGVVTVKITRALVPACQYVLGQVTPEGKVHMTMYDSETGDVINYPVGTMVKKRGEWTMVNEMTSNTQGGGTLSHWAYMVQSKRGDRTFRNLPFAHESIPEFMSACPKGPPILHKPKRK
jgi:hypothetical protein